MKFASRIVFVVGLTLLLALPMLALADSQYEESVTGDLSNDRLNPTALTLGFGSNKIQGVTGSGDRDYVTVALPVGMALDALFVENYQSTDGAAFIGIQAGTQLTEPSTGTTTANLLGYTLFGTTSNTVNTDILDNIGLGPGTIGFTAPLTGTHYTFWIQQVGDPTTYTLDLRTSPATSMLTYDDAATANGDLSDDRLYPTAISLVAGGNVLKTAVQGSADVEYFTVTVPNGHTLQAVLLNDYVSADNLAFAAVQAGSTFTESPQSADVANLLGYAHFGPAQNHVGADILDELGAGDGAMGFSGGLPAGDYTFWTQQAGGTPTVYELEFVVVEAATTRSFVYLPIIMR